MTQTQLGPYYVGQTRPAWTVEVRLSNNSPLVLTGAEFAGGLVNLKSGAVKALTVGNYAIEDAANGKFSYSPATADMSEAGMWEFRTTITISSQTYMVAILIPILPWKIT